MWKYKNPVEVVFCDELMSSIKDKVQGRGFAIVTYNEKYFIDKAEEIKSKVPGCYIILTDVFDNPDINDIPKINDSFSPFQSDVEVLVAIGGGSVIDTTKALSVSGGSQSKLVAVLKDGQDVGQTLPIIAVPTTTGTGSEVTSWATIWDKTNGKKYSLNHSSLYPECAICSPELTLNLPLSLTVQTGLDALSHALESIWNINANDVSFVFARDAIKKIIDVLPKLLTDPKCSVLRKEMFLASTFAGFAFSNTKTAIAHNISYAVTLEKGIAHGIACSFTLPHILNSFNDECCKASVHLKEVFGQDLASASSNLNKWINDLGVKTHPSEYGYSKEEWESLVNNAVSGERGKNFSGNSTALLSSVNW